MRQVMEVESHDSQHSAFRWHAGAIHEVSDGDYVGIEQFPGKGCSTMRPMTRKSFGALPFFQNENLCAYSLRLLLSYFRLRLQPIL